VVAKLLIPQIESAWGIKVPDREPWENKSQRRETFHGNEKESRQEKETLSERMLEELPKASREKHLSGGCFIFVRDSLAWRELRELQLA